MTGANKKTTTGKHKKDTQKREQQKFKPNSVDAYEYVRDMYSKYRPQIIFFPFGP